MENYFRVTEIGDLVEKTWTPEGGETRNLASAEVTITNGLDIIVAEASDDLARNLVKARDEKLFDFDGFYQVRLRFKVATSKEKKLKFNNIRLWEINQL